MATVNKDFKIKSGLIVEGLQGTINGNVILTENAGDQYILDLIGGETLVKSVSGNLSVDGSGNLSINQTGLAADLSGSYLYDNTGTINLDIEGVYDDLINSGVATTTNITDAINTEVTNRNSAIATAKGEAEDYADTVAGTAESNAKSYADGLASNYDPAGSAATAQGNAEDYADGLISTEVTNRNSAIATAKGEAISSSNSYTDSAISTEVSDRNSAISSAISTEVTNRNSAISTAKSQAIADANSYTDAEVAALVDSAPELLNTLNELAAAIADNPNYATDAASAVAGRVAKSGDTMTGDLVLPGAPTLNLHAATKGYVDGEIDTLDTAAQGYATTAQTNAEGYADDLISQEVTDRNSAISSAITALDLSNTYDSKGSAAQAYTDAVAAAASDATTKADAALQSANGYTDSAVSAALSDAQNYTDTEIDALTTDDIEEGSTNQYFTDYRAKVSAVDLLTNATKENIEITWTNQGGLVIAAENGVADSTTDDLEEGSTNLYFQDSRVLDAVSGSNIQPASVDITWVRREEATWTGVPTASTATVHSFGTNKGSVKYLVRVISGSFSHVTEILATTDASNNVAVVEYGTIYTSEDPLATATVVWNAGSSQYNLNVTTANNNSEVLVAATLLSYND